MTSQDSPAMAASPATPPLRRRHTVVPAALTWSVAVGNCVAFVALGSILDGAFAGFRLGSGEVPGGLALPAAAVIALVCGVALSAGAGYLAARLSLRAIGPRETERRDVLLDQLFRLGVAFRTEQRAGRFVSTATDGVERVAFYEATFLGPMIASISVPVIALLVLGGAIDWMIAGLLALAVPAIPLVVGGMQRAFRAVSTQYRGTSRRFAAQFLDALQGLPTATAFNQAEAKGAQLARGAEALRRQVMALLRRNQIVLLVIDSSFSLAMVTLAAGLAMWRLGHGAISPGQAIAVVLISTVLLEPLGRVGQFFYVGMGGRAAAREIEAVLGLRPAVADPPGATAPVVVRDSPESPSRGEALRVERVSHSYHPGALVLDDVSLVVPEGSRVALIGPSGSGKTTLTSIVQAHLRPDVGRVLVRGHDVGAAPVDWVRAQMSVVAQSTYLFSGTLADNLRLADPAADEERLWWALAEANLAADVRAMPGQLEATVGERGLSMSGGQAQRVAVARALLKDAPLLVLDEPTSQVDVESETALVDALERLGRGRSVLVVAHRLSTVRNADLVVVMEGGRVVEQGAPADLASVDSYFARALDLSDAGHGR